MKIGITGARGFIGTHIVSRLREKKGVSIAECSRPACNMLDAQDVAQFVRGKDVIIHAAAVNRGTDTEVIAGTIVSVYNLISAASKQKKKPKIIFLSSIQAETETIYGQAKRLAEVMLEEYSKSYRAPVSIFRIANVFGEGCRPFYNSVVATFCHQLARGEAITVNPNNKKFNFVYVGDLADEIIKESFVARAKLFSFKRVTSKNELTIPALALLLKKISISGGKGLKNSFEKKLYATYTSYITQ